MSFVGRVARAAALLVPMNQSKKLIPALVGIAVLAALLWRFGGAGLADASAGVRPSLLAFYLVLAIAVLLGYALRWWVVARAIGRAPSFARLVIARLAGDAVGGLVPSAKLAGEPIRIALLRAHGVPVIEAGAGVAVDRLLELAGNACSVVAYATVFLLSRDSRLGDRTLLVSAAVLLAWMAVPFAFWRRGRRPFAPFYAPALRRAVPRLIPWMVAVERTEDRLIGLLRERPGDVVRGLLASLAIEGLIVVEHYFLLASFGVFVGLPTLLLVVLGSGVARAVPTPAGLGALEASQVGAIALAGGRPETGLLVGIVLRLHESFWMLLGLGALYAQGVSGGRLRAVVSERALT